jgi:hypothetical protein
MACERVAFYTGKFLSRRDMRGETSRARLHQGRRQHRPVCESRRNAHRSQSTSFEAGRWRPGSSAAFSLNATRRSGRRCPRGESASAALKTLMVFSADFVLRCAVSTVLAAQRSASVSFAPPGCWTRARAPRRGRPALRSRKENHPREAALAGARPHRRAKPRRAKRRQRSGVP